MVYFTAWLTILAVLLAGAYALRNTEGSGCFTVVVFALFFLGTIIMIVGPEAAVVLFISSPALILLYDKFFFSKKKARDMELAKPFIEQVEADPDIIEKCNQDICEELGLTRNPVKPSKEQIRRFKIKYASRLAKEHTGKNIRYVIEDYYEELDKKESEEEQK